MTGCNPQGVELGFPCYSLYGDEFDFKKESALDGSKEFDMADSNVDTRESIIPETIA